jgi:hypothetical protein
MKLKVLEYGGKSETTREVPTSIYARRETYLLTWRQGEIIIKDSSSDCRWSRWLVGVESNIIKIQ